MIASFALRMVCGAGLQWALLPRTKITSGFFRVQMLVALGLLVLAALTVGREMPSTVTWSGAAVWGSVGLAVVAYLGSIAWMLERRAGGTVCVFVLLFGTWGALAAGATLDGPAIDAAYAFRLAVATASAGTIGGSVTAMLLGHWYLTATGMSLDPLKRSNTLFGAALVARLGLSAVALARSHALVTSQTQTLWLALHWLAGLAGPLAAVLMVRRILAYRNTQSATGVLFAAVILVFIGELSATLLGRELSATF